MDNFLDNERRLALEFTLKSLTAVRGHLLNIMHNMRFDSLIIQDSQRVMVSINDILSRVQKIESDLPPLSPRLKNQKGSHEDTL